MKKAALGFTLVEILIVYTLIAILSTIGLASLVNVSRRQTVDTSAAEVLTMLNLAKSLAVAQVKPQTGTCIGPSAKPLDGYQIVIDTSADPNLSYREYHLEALCGGDVYPIANQSKKLPNNVVFDQSSLTTVFFNVHTGIVSTYGSIIITGYNFERIISINGTGIVAYSGSVLFTATPVPSATPTGGLQGPTPTPTIYKRVFLTSSKYKGDIGGLAAADHYCQTTAQAVNVSGVWIAWLSDDNTNAKSRISDGIYIRMDGTVVANSKADLTDGTLASEIFIQEDGTMNKNAAVWTGTQQSGINAPNNCSAWTTQNGSIKGKIGLARRTDATWTENSSAGCGNTYHLYCFEQ